ncbi:MAG: MBL fold metallo-hydrolase [Desulfobacterales bacterium]
MQLAENLHGFFWDSMTQNNCNTYLIDGPLRVLIDPGHRALFGHVERGLTALGVTLGDIDLVLCTHAHPDHIEAAELFQDLPAQVAIHETEWQMVMDNAPRIQALFGFDPQRIIPDLFLQDGQLDLKGLKLEVYHTPGHSPGSVCLYWPAEKVLFSGDLIFKDGIGRTDLPGGDGSRIKASIRGLTHLPIELLLPGHGAALQGAEAVAENFTQLEQVWFNYV